MRKILYFMAAVMTAFIIGTEAKAQEVTVEADSLVFVPAACLDESLAGKSVFNGLNVHQPSAVSRALSRKIEANKSKKISGYRIRIYFDNKQNSRIESERVKTQFEQTWPGYGAYLTFSSPYFSVTVGNFRTKTDAMQFLQSIKGAYPSAFVIKENIEFPPIDRHHLYEVDTVKVVIPESLSI